MKFQDKLEDFSYQLSILENEFYKKKILFAKDFCIEKIFPTSEFTVKITNNKLHLVNLSYHSANTGFKHLTIYFDNAFFVEIKSKCIIIGYDNEDEISTQDEKNKLIEFAEKYNIKIKEVEFKDLIKEYSKKWSLAQYKDALANRLALDIFNSQNFKFTESVDSFSLITSNYKQEMDDQLPVTSTIIDDNFEIRIYPECCVIYTVNNDDSNDCFDSMRQLKFFAVKYNISVEN